MFDACLAGLTLMTAWWCSYAKTCTARGEPSKSHGLITPLGASQETGMLSTVATNAAEVLRKHDLSCKEVIQVDSDAILYLSGIGRPMTAWLTFVDESLRVFVESGFQAVRPPYADHLANPETVL
jgi:hypothetical protein